jgi:hypothetical protein
VHTGRIEPARARVRQVEAVAGDISGTCTRAPSSPRTTRKLPTASMKRSAPTSRTGPSSRLGSCWRMANGCDASVVLPNRALRCETHATPSTPWAAQPEGPGAQGATRIRRVQPPTQPHRPRPADGPGASDRPARRPGAVKPGNRLTAVSLPPHHRNPPAPPLPQARDYRSWRTLPGALCAPSTVEPREEGTQASLGGLDGYMRTMYVMHHVRRAAKGDSDFKMFRAHVLAPTAFPSGVVIYRRLHPATGGTTSGALGGAVTSAGGRWSR